MSRAPISRSPDLQRLRNEGYGVAVADGALVVEPVPFLDADGDIREGALISDLDMANDRTTEPSSHVAYFAGGTPHDASGRRLDNLINNDRQQQKGGRTTAHTLSSKPGPSGYADYYQKMHTYATAIASHAEAVDPSVTARCFPVAPTDGGDGPFAYADTASARAGVDTSMFTGLSVAIVGLGGTGAFALDLVAKTPVAGIHLYDGDRLLQHNAFRAPGAIPEQQLEEKPNKAEYWAGVYAAVHHGVTAHPYRIDDGNVSELRDHDFVFVCVDDNETRILIARQLRDAGVTFIDTGLGLYRTDRNTLAGTIRTTTATPQKHDHTDTRLPEGLPDPDAEYQTNIQIADLNMLNAALAVVRWKRLVGLYADQENEHHSCYSVAGNVVVNEDQG